MERSTGQMLTGGAIDAVQHGSGQGLDEVRARSDAEPDTVTSTRGPVAMSAQLIMRLEDDGADLELIGDSVEMIMASVRRTRSAMVLLHIPEAGEVARLERARQRLIVALGSLGEQLGTIDAR
jgi:hypothetical protein